jgi:ABC-2 type transport system permease protein
MNHYLVFFKKELVEYARTFKLLIMLVVFAIFGITNPLIAKLTPELLATLMPEGMSVTIPEPSAFDSWAQFFKNTQQMGLIVLVLVFSGILYSEISRGTLINLLTKGLSRQAVIWAKYSAMLFVWSFSVLVSAALTWVYTVYLFPNDQLMVGYLLFAVSCMWLFGAFLLAVLLSSATLVEGNYGSLLLTGLVVVLLAILSIFPSMKDYNPLALASQNMEVVAGRVDPASLYTAVGVSIVAALGLVALATMVFSRKRL